jgi:hypothetical protein
MFDVDAALDTRRPIREACLGASMVCEPASASQAGFSSSVRGLPADRILWSRGEVIALRRRGAGRSHGS